jgi:hypothetical protein
VKEEEKDMKAAVKTTSTSTGLLEIKDNAIDERLQRIT